MVTRVLAESKTTGSARALMFYLAWRHDDKKGHAYPTRTEIAQNVRCSLRNIVYLLQSIEEAGELRVVRRHGTRTEENRTEYHLFPDSKVQASAHSKVQALSEQSATRERATHPAPKREKNRKGGRSFDNGGRNLPRPSSRKEVGGSNGRPTSNGRWDIAYLESEQIRSLSDDELNVAGTSAKEGAELNDSEAVVAWQLLRDELNRRRSVEA